jgi:hypothetical protein
MTFSSRFRLTAEAALFASVCLPIDMFAYENDAMGSTWLATVRSIGHILSEAKMILPTRNSMIPTVTIPALRALKVARFCVEGAPEVELVAPVAMSIRPVSAGSSTKTVRPGRKAR